MTEKGASHQRQSPLFVSACRRLPLTLALFRAFAAHETLRLTVKYRTLDEELRHLLNILLEPLVESHGMTAIKPWFTDNLYAAISSSPRWANVFFARGTVDVLDVELTDLRWRSEHLALDEAGFRSLVEIWESAVEVRTTFLVLQISYRLLTRLHFQILDTKVFPTTGPDDLHWRTLQIPVDVPLRQVRPPSSHVLLPVPCLTFDSDPQ